MATVHDYDAIDLGCGQDKYDGAYGVDIVEGPDVDRVIDLEQMPWDLPANHFSYIHCNDILEHMADPLAFMEEVYKIAADDAEIFIRTPHFTNANAWTDPTHNRPFSAATFEDYFTQEGDYSYYTDATFALKELRIGFIPARRLPWNIVGRVIANRWTWMYEHSFLRSLFPAGSMEIKFKAIK